jgi:hypothetical protein
MKKRGLIELHFNWIFILIAGAIIFVFFINVVNKQKDLSEIKTSATIVTSLESILTGAQISTDTINIVDLPKVDIGFECNRYFIGAIPKQIKGNVIFAPNLLKGKKLITWALDWNMPYRVTNFLYLTDPQLRYVLVHDSNTQSIATKIYDELPQEMNKELIENINNFKNKNNYKVKFIFLINPNNNVLTKLSNMANEDVTAINLTDIGTSNIIPSTGTIEFFQKKENTWESKGTTYYLKKESLFGAIFADDKDIYDCVMKKAFKKLNLVSKIYSERSEELSTNYGTGTRCYSPHSSANIPIDSMKITSADELNNFPANGLPRMNAMKDYNINIKNENQRAQLFSCALIY